MVELTRSQRMAVQVLETSNLSLLTGGPGTGKTTTLAEWLKDTSEIDTICMAPTGRAARRMEEAFAEAGVQLSAKTIHSSLGPQRNGHDRMGWGFAYNADNHLEAERIVVDESSMIDTNLMWSLMQAISPGTQLVLVGDPDQLPPVGKGSPFLDMIESGMVPHARLFEVHRYAGRIAHVCRQVQQGERITPSKAIDLDADASDVGPENFRHIEKPSGPAQVDALKLVLGKVQERGFNLQRDVQILVCRNTEGPVSRVAVNEFAQRLLNPSGRSAPNCPFRVKDKVMCLQNGMYSARERHFSGSWEEVGQAYLTNGEIGSVLHVSGSLAIARFGPRKIAFTKAMWNKSICLSYAITSHKSQGGGWPVVIYLVDNAMMVDRNMIYTAFSRSKQLCVTVGRLATLNEQVKKVHLRDRKTFLTEYLTHGGAIQTDHVDRGDRHPRAIRL